MCAEEAIQVDIVVPDKKRYLSLIGNIAEAMVNALDDYSGDHDALAFHMNLALTEALVNAIEHSQHTGQNQLVRVSICIEECDLYARVYDHGQGFDIDLVPTPDLEELSQSGRGIFLMRALMDRVSYSKTDTGNVPEMHKRLD